MNRPDIRWAEQPGDKPPMLKIVHADHLRRQELMVLNAHEVGVFGHWDDRLKRNVPCTDPYGCVCQERQVSCWWRCYLGVMDHARKVRIAEITSDAWREARGAMLREQRGTLRGLKLVLDRQPRLKTGRVVAQFFEPSVEFDPNGLPPEPRVKDELQRIWYARL